MEAGVSLDDWEDWEDWEAVEGSVVVQPGARHRRDHETVSK